MLQTSTTTRSSNSKQRPRFKMRCNNNNSNRAMLNMLLFLGCCCACTLWSTAAAARVPNPTKTTITTTTAATAYFDVNSAENGAVLSAAGGDGGNNIQDDVADEILQLPHAFRHQEHYSHRIEQAVNDFKRAQLEQQLQLQQQQHEAKSSVANATAVAADVVSNINNYNSNNWQHIEQQQELAQQQQHHHRRHEQHLRQHQPQFEVQQQQQHHLRHHNRHHATWEQRVFPALRHQRHQQQQQLHERALKSATDTATATTMRSIYASNELETLPRGTINVTHALQTRYFDRDGLYSKPRAAASHASAVWVRTTRGPHARHFNGNAYASFKKLDEREFSDEAPYDEADARDDVNANDGATDESDAAANHLNGRRFSLKLSAHDAETGRAVAAEGNNDETVDDNKNDKENGEDDDDNEDDDDDDYSYEDEEPPKAHDFTSNAGKAKISVKRYTNPFKSFKSSPVRHYETAYEDGSVYNNNNHDNQQHYVSNNKNNYHNNNDDNANNDDNNNDNDDNDDDADNSNSSESSDDTVYTSEKWHRIEQQHHLKQLQHQRELQRRLQHSTSGSNSRNSAAIATNAAAKRQIKHDDDVDSIFSRNYIPGTLTRQKQEELGTLEAVHQTRRNHVIKQMQHKALANAHAKQIFSEASCRLPQRRVERIQRDPTKIYTPHCTVLHRCADDTGCCKSDRQTCAPKRTKSVDLYFFVKSINDKRGSIERLTFINHTECHCVDKAKEQPAEYGSTALYGGAGGNAQMLRRATILNCNCPKLYEKILQEDGFCRCDCSSGNTGCDWLKRGMEHFSMIDRKCISEGRCKPPTCAYGSYIKKHGRCPKREEQLSATLIGGSTPLTTNSIKSRGYH